MAKMTHSEAGRLGGFASREAVKLRHRKNVEQYEKDPKRCPYCGKVLPYNKRRNKFCSQSCATSYNNLLRGTRKDAKVTKEDLKERNKFCLNCGKKLKVSRNSAGKYCCNQCQADYQAKERVSLWKKGELSGLHGTVVASWLKKYLLEKVGYKCEKCGWSEIHPVTGKVPLEVHHIDGDYRNNTEDNLQVLCPNCHSLTENFKNLNKSKGRDERRSTNL